MTQKSTPTLAQIRSTRDGLANYVAETPTWQWQDDLIRRHFGPNAVVHLKLELLQHTGSFKPRGALTRMQTLSSAELARGVTAVSAGNHAAAVGYAARVLHSSAKVVMPAGASPARVALCQSYGAEVVIADDVHQAFDMVHQIETDEGRTFIHPFEGQAVALGTGTLGLEFCTQVGELDAIVIPIGGGGLCAGVATAVKQLNPRCVVYGVEPVGADSMQRSFQAGTPQKIDKVATIADSLGAPFCAPYSFGLCQRFVDELVQVDDDDLCRALYLLFDRIKLAVEPAGAASTAAALGPLKARLAGRKFGLIICGANIDPDSFCRYLKRGENIWRLEPGL